MHDHDLLLWAYVALAALAALALLASRWPAWAKALLVAGVTGLYFAADAALQGSWGWPSRDNLPERFVLLAVVVEEPKAGQAGALYLWVNGLQEGKPLRRPRAYQLPYDKSLHGQLEEAMKKTRQGVTQLGTTEPRRGPQGNSWLRPGSVPEDLKIRDLPQPQLPEK